MSQKDVYKQCKLTKRVGKATLHHVAWIPNVFAKVGKEISLRQTVGDGCVRSFEGWDSGWVVSEVYSARFFGDLDSQRDAHKRWENVLDRG